MADVMVLKVGDIFNVKVSVATSGNQIFRTIACGVTWPTAIVDPVLTGATPVFVDGNLFAGLDYEVKVTKTGDELAVLKALKSGASVSQTGDIVIVQFVATNVGEGVFTLTDLQGIDIENDLPVLRPIESEGDAPIKTETTTSAGSIILKIQVIR
ncbi:MAG TPA: hypothetical protein PKN48_00860 [Bacteroidales bacterium]|nr:hypothetical protein [Bacteroidales bacterium]